MSVGRTVPLERMSQIANSLLLPIKLILMEKYLAICLRSAEEISKGVGMGNMLGGEDYYGDFVICKSCFKKMESPYILKHEFSSINFSFPRKITNLHLF